MVFETVTNSVWAARNVSGNVITKIPADGSGNTNYTLGNNGNCVQAITFDPNGGYLYVLGNSVTDGRYVIWKVDPANGSVVQKIKPSAVPTNFSDIVFDSSRNLIYFTANRQIIKINSDGTGESPCSSQLASAYNTGALLLDNNFNFVFLDAGSMTINDAIYKYNLPNCSAPVLSPYSPSNVFGWTYDSSTRSIWTVDNLISNHLHKLQVDSNLTEASLTPTLITMNDISYDSKGSTIWANNTASGTVLYKINPGNGSITATYNQSGSDYSPGYLLYDPNQRLWGLGNGTGKHVMKWVLAQYISPATFTSQIFDLPNASYGVGSWTTFVPAATALTVKVRSGNQANLSDATDFASCSPATSGLLTNNSCVHDGQRYFQYQLTLTTGDITKTAQLNDITLGYNAYQSGTLTSSPYDSAFNTNILTSLQWTTAGSGTITFQMRTSPDNLTWTTWQGPTGTGDYYTTNTGQTMNPIHRDGINDRYFQYRAYLQPANGGSAPAITSVTVNDLESARPSTLGQGIYSNGDLYIRPSSLTATQLVSGNPVLRAIKITREVSPATLVDLHVPGGIKLNGYLPDGWPVISSQSPWQITNGSYLTPVDPAKAIAFSQPIADVPALEIYGNNPDAALHVSNVNLAAGAEAALFVGGINAGGNIVVDPRAGGDEIVFDATDIFNHRNHYRVWHAGNDGRDSGLDASKLDGNSQAFYAGSFSGQSDALNNCQTPTAICLCGSFPPPPGSLDGVRCVRLKP